MMRWENVFVRKAFMSGNSLAVRIPKKLADAIQLREGDTVDFQLLPGPGKRVTIVKVPGEGKK